MGLDMGIICNHERSSTSGFNNDVTIQMYPVSEFDTAVDYSDE